MDEPFLKEALALARTRSADGRHGPFGAIIVRDGATIARGWNQVVEARDPTAHAEIMAIREACRRLNTHTLFDCVLYCSCEPCPMCLAAAFWARIERIVFAASARDAAAAGFDDERIAAELGHPWEARAIKWHQALAVEGREILRAWQANPHRIPY